MILLRNENFDLSRIKVCDYDLDSSFLEATNDKGSYLRTNANEIHGVERNIEPVTVQDDVEQPSETPVALESHQSEFKIESHDISIPMNTDVISHVKEPNNSQTDLLNGDRANIEVFDSENCSIIPGLESSPLTNSVFDNNHCMPDDYAAPLAVKDKTNDIDDSMHTDIVGIPAAQSSHALPILEDELVGDKSNRSGLDTTEISEDRVEIGTQVQIDGSEAANNLYAALATDSNRTDECTNNQGSLNRDIHMEENESMLGGINEDQILASGPGYDDKDSRSGCSNTENIRVDCLHGVPVGVDAETSLINEENSVSQEAVLRSTMHPEISAIESPLVDQNDVSSPIYVIKPDVYWDIFNTSQKSKRSI